MTPILSVTGLTKRYGDTTVLRDIAFTAEPGRVTAVIGQSGSGKTTLLKCLNGLACIDAGSIEIAGHRIAPDMPGDASALRRDVGMIFQQFHLWPHKTVLENIIEGPVLVRGLTRDAAVEQAAGFLQRLGLADKADAYPLTLSGGQQQRVAVARAMAIKPTVLLLDEVTSALDPELTWEMRQTIRSLAQDKKQTMVLVTHDIALARDIADDMLFLDRGEILERGTPSAILINPTHPRLREFLAHCC